MILGEMSKEKALEIYRGSEKLQAEAKAHMLESIEWDRDDFVGFHFGHEDDYGLEYYSAAIDMVEINGILHAEVYANSYAKIEFLADASKLLKVKYTKVSEAIKAIEAMLTEEWQQRLSNEVLEGYFLDNYDWLYDDYEVEEN